MLRPFIQYVYKLLSNLPCNVCIGAFSAEAMLVGDACGNARQWHLAPKLAPTSCPQAVSRSFEVFSLSLVVVAALVTVAADFVGTRLFPDVGTPMAPRASQGHAAAIAHRSTTGRLRFWLIVPAFGPNSFRFLARIHVDVAQEPFLDAVSMSN